MPPGRGAACSVWRPMPLAATGWVLVAAVLAASSLPASAGPEGARATIPHGYEYKGHKEVKLALQDTSAQAVAPSAAQQSGSPAKGHTSVLATSDGHIYTKPLQHRARDRVLFEEAQYTARQFANSSLNPDLACQGCPSTDTRTRVSDTTVQPFSAIGMLRRNEQQALSELVAQCTGTLIGPNRQHVLTAAHCVVDTTANTTITAITFYPGSDGTSNAPFATVETAHARYLQEYLDLVVGQGDATPLSLNYDFSLILLKEPAPAGTTTLNFQAGQGTVIVDLTTAGYPADESPSGSMWTVQCPQNTINFDGSDVPGYGSDGANIAVHNCISFGGQSGSAIWTTGADNNYSIQAVLTGSLSGVDSAPLNTGVKMDSFVYNTLVTWFAEDNATGLTYAPPSPPDSPSPSSTIDTSNSPFFSNHVYIAIVPAIIVGVIVILLLLLCCGFCRRRSRVPGPTPYPQQNGAYPPGYVNGAAQNGYPQNGAYNNGYSNGMPPAAAQSEFAQSAYRAAQRDPPPPAGNVQMGYSAGYPQAYQPNGRTF